MNTKYNIAIVGITGLVGRTIFKILIRRKFPMKKVFFIASNKSLHINIIYNNRKYIVHDINNFNFKNIDIVFFASSKKISKKYIPVASKKKCFIIDNSNVFRNISNIPLIIPEINFKQINLYHVKNIISNPNCLTTQILAVVKPILQKANITHININSYQSISGIGKSALKKYIYQFLTIS